MLFCSILVVLVSLCLAETTDDVAAVLKTLQVCIRNHYSCLLDGNR